jgi:DNA-binding transcriptional LysR family regulator
MASGSSPSVGVSLLPRAVVATAERQGLVRVHPLRSAETKIATVFLRRTGNFVPATLRIFIDCATNNAPPLMAAG